MENIPLRNEIEPIEQENPFSLLPIEDDIIDINSFPTEGLANWSCLKELHVHLAGLDYDKNARSKFLIVLPTIFRKATNLKTFTYFGKPNYLTKGIQLVTSDSAEKTLCKLETLGSPEIALDFSKTTKEHHWAILKLNMRLKKVYLRLAGDIELHILEKFKETLEFVWIGAYGPDFSLPPLSR
ncbi:hypothetical protein Fcan01_10207, partial [Folsomia candida]